jgi:serine/threonine protein kinase/tetratricopeptide (TPR) repeat protein
MSDGTPGQDTIEQLAEEWRDRLRRGERFEADEYIARCPHLADEIRDLFDAVVMIEELKPSVGDLTGAFTGNLGAVDGAPRLERLGDFRILREVGRGGMGVVYEAEQESLGRRVALKVLPAQALADRQQHKRFQREARATARLHHTNIVPVYGVGEHDGMAYYVMQFIQGAPLDQVLAELKRLRKAKSTATTKQPTPQAGASKAPTTNPNQPGADGAAAGVARSLMTGIFSPADSSKDKNGSSGQQSSLVRQPASGGSGSSSGVDGSGTVSQSSVRMPGQAGHLPMADSGRHYYQSVAGIGLQVAEALEFANSQGIIHRDIKPSNLLLDNHGTVWVTDFGLAKALADAENLTHTGDIVGTLRYMAPERFTGHADARGDIYSLGLTLYELLVQEPAFGETDRNRLIHQVTHDDLVPPRKRNPEIPRDLETIVLKACDREPRRRYATAGAMADDLKRFLGDRPIAARRVSTVERLWRWCRRNPSQAGLVAGVLLLLMVIAVGASVAAVHFQRLAEHEADARERVQDALRATEQARLGEARQRAEAQKASQLAEVARHNEALERGKAAAAQKLAEENFQEARRAVEQLVTRVSEGRLKNLPGMQPVRKELLEAAMFYYQGFVDRHAEDPTLKSDLADACTRLAGILAEIGSTREALKLHQRAEQLFVELRALRPKDKKLHLALVANYRAMGALQRRLNDADAAMTALDNAYAMLLAISPQDPKRLTKVPILQNMVHGNVRMHISNDPEILQAFANVLNDQGLLRQAQAPAEAIDYYVEALYIRRRLLASQVYTTGNPARAIYEHEMARQWSLMGRPYADQQMHGAALQYQVEARSMLEHVLRAYPEYGRLDEITRDLALVDETLGELYAATGQFAPALESYKKALGYREPRAAQNPAVADFQRELIDCWYKRALVEAQVGRPDKTAEILRPIIDRQRNLCAMVPDDKSHVRTLAHQWLALARLEKQRDPALGGPSHASACRELERLLTSPLSVAATVAMLGPLTVAAPPPYVDLFRGEARDFVTYAAVLAAINEPEAALASLRRAADAGFTDAGALDHTPEFAALKNRWEYAMVLALVKARTHVISWMTDYDEARARAMRERKDLFLYFGGSDWEPTGVWFQRNMLTHPIIAPYLNKYFVCVDLDRPRFRPVPPNHEQIQELINRWDARYTATMVLADAHGRAFWKSNKGSSELERWESPQEFLTALQKQLSLRKQRDVRLAAAEKLASDADKAMQFDIALQKMPSYNASDYQDIYARIYQLDRDNQLGLRVKYFAHCLASGRAKIRILLEKRQWHEALAECDLLLEELTRSGQSGLDQLIAIGQVKRSLYADRGYAHVGLGMFDRAAIDFARDQALHTDDLEAALLHAYALVQLGDTAAYRRLCADLLRRHDTTNNQWHVFLIAWTCGLAPDALDDYSRLIALTDRAVLSSLTKHLLWNAQGLLYYRAGKLAEAEKAVRRSMLATPRWRGRNELVLALIEARRGNAKEARKWLDRALRPAAPGEDASLAANTGKLHETGYRDMLVYQQLLEEAVVRFDGAPLDAFPALQTRRYRGLMHLGQWDQALAMLDKAVAAEPDNVVRHLERARCHEALKQPQQAVAEVEMALKLKTQALEKARKSVTAGAQGYANRQALGDACREVAQLQVRLGRPFDAAQTLGILDEVWQGKPGALFEAARDMAALQPDLGRITAAAEQERWRHVADASVLALRHALDAGYLDSNRVRKEAAFKTLAQRSDFRVICDEMAMRRKFTIATASVIPFAGGPSLAAVLEARNLAAVYDWDRAEKRYDQAVSASSDEVVLRRERARFLALRGKWRQAIADLDIVVERAPDQLEGWLERGRCHAMLEDWDATAGDFLKVLDLLPKEHAFQSPSSRACKELAEWEPALRKAAALRPGDTRFLIGRARYLYLRGLWREAAAAFAEVIEAHPPGEEWYEAVATTALAGDEDAFRRLLNGFKERAGAEPSAGVAYTLARAHSIRPNTPGNPMQAITWGQRAVNDRPGAGWFVHALGMAQVRAGLAPSSVRPGDKEFDRLAQFRTARFQSALQQFQSSLDLGWGRELNPYYMALAYHHLGEAAKARQFFDIARAQLNLARPVLAGEPTTLLESDWLEANLIDQELEALLNVPHRREAEANAREGRWAQAIAHLDALIQRDPEFWPDRMRRGEAHARLGHWAAAAADYARVLEHQPHAPIFWFENACLQLQLDGNAAYQQSCARMYERIGSSRVVDDVVFGAHGFVLASGALPDPANVVKVAKERLALTPPPSSHNAFSVHVLGLAYYRAGQHADAVECLSKDPAPKNPEAIAPLNWLVLALAEEKRGHHAAAREWLAQADESLSEAQRKLPPGAVVPTTWMWRDWILVQSLHREAHRAMAERR